MPSPAVVRTYADILHGRTVKQVAFDAALKKDWIEVEVEVAVEQEFAPAQFPPLNREPQSPLSSQFEWIDKEEEESEQYYDKDQEYFTEEVEQKIESEPSYDQEYEDDEGYDSDYDYDEFSFSSSISSALSTHDRSVIDRCPHFCGSSSYIHRRSVRQSVGEGRIAVSVRNQIRSAPPTARSVMARHAPTVPRESSTNHHNFRSERMIAGIPHPYLNDQDSPVKRVMTSHGLAQLRARERAMKEWETKIAQELKRRNNCTRVQNNQPPINTTHSSSSAATKSSRSLRSLIHRHTTAHIRRIAESGSTWANVLHQRQATKALVAEQRSLRPGRMNCNKRPSPSRPHSSSTQLSSVHSRLQQIHRQLRVVHTTTTQKQMHRLDQSSTNLSAIPSAAGMRWLKQQRGAAEEKPSLAPNSASPSTVPSSQSSPCSSSPVSRRLYQYQPLLNLEHDFNTFRREWFFAHHSAIVRSLDPILHCHRVTGVRLAPISMAVANRFMAKRLELGNDVPLLTYHGTAPYNFDSIMKYGLLRPGRHTEDGRTIRVIHGSSLGSGVYSSTDAHFALSYAAGPLTNSIIICALLDKDRHHSLTPNSNQPNGRHGTWVRYSLPQVVCFDESRIIPLFWLDFQPSQSMSSPPLPRVSLKIPRGDCWRVWTSKAHMRPIKMVSKRLIRDIAQLLHNKSRRAEKMINGSLKSQALNQ